MAMKALVTLIACGLACMAAPAFSSFSTVEAQAGPAMIETPWYPLKVGNKWHYRVVVADAPGQKKDDPARNKNGDPAKKVVMEVKELTQIEFVRDAKTEKVSAYRIEGASADRDNPKRKDQADRQLTQYISVSADGVYQYVERDKEITPPLRILKLPPVEGDSWKNNLTVDRKHVMGTFTIREEKIRVLAGTYETMHVSGEFTVDSGKMTTDYWFASGVGIVKQGVHLGTFIQVLELEKFEAAAAR